MKKKLLFLILCLGMFSIAQVQAQPRQCKLHSWYHGHVAHINLYIGSRFVQSLPVDYNNSFVFSLPRVYSTDLTSISAVFGEGLSSSNSDVQVAMLNMGATLITGETINEYMGPAYSRRPSTGVILYVYSTGSCSISGNANSLSVSVNLKTGWNTIKLCHNDGTMVSVNGDQGWNWGTD